MEEKPEITEVHPGMKIKVMVEINNGKPTYSKKYRSWKEPRTFTVVLRDGEYWCECFEIKRNMKYELRKFKLKPSLQPKNQNNNPKNK